MVVDITNPLYIKVSKNGTDNIETLIKKNIVNITPNFAVVPLEHPLQQVYPYPTITKITIEFTDGVKFDMELQDVTNHATWSTGTQAGVNQAVTDIQASL